MQTNMNLSGHTLNIQEKNLVRQAFAVSCAALSANGDSRFQGRQGYYAREAVAKLVVGYAKAGERDPQNLSKAVISQMNAL